MSPAAGLSARPRFLLPLLTLSLLGTGACDLAAGGPDPDRAPIGKADLVGSCADSDFCGGPSEGGNCYCDSACAQYGDCCADKEQVCGGFKAVTYNVGLAHGAVPLADERVQPLIDELSSSDADVLCLEELWTDEDYEAVQAGLEQTFPFSFQERTESDESFHFACTLDFIDVWRLKSCVADKCTPNGISAFECVADQCKSRYDEIGNTCKLCLAANTTDPLSCLSFSADKYANDGRNGIALFSRYPIDDAFYVPFDTAVVKRGAIYASVDGVRVECTHMSADLGSVPYPEDRPFSSWAEEHEAQIATLDDLAGGQCTLLLGDLNSGPVGPEVEGELEANFRALQDAGFEDRNAPDFPCTYCSENPMVGGDHDARIDHGLFKNCPASTPGYRRLFDQQIEITDSAGRLQKTRLSDHYGLEVSL